MVLVPPEKKKKKSYWDVDIAFRWMHGAKLSAMPRCKKISLSLGCL